MSDNERQGQGQVCLCVLPSGLGFRGGVKSVYHKTFSFLSSTVSQEHFFSGCRLCLQHFRDPMLALLLPTKVVALPQGLLFPMLHSALSWFCLLLPCTLLRLALLRVLQQNLGCPFSVLSNGNGSWHCSISDHVWSENPFRPCLAASVSSQMLLPHLCGCWPVSPAWGGLAATLRRHFYALPKT